jgi:hypothetical protein
MSLCHDDAVPLLCHVLHDAFSGFEYGLAVYQILNFTVIPETPAFLSLTAECFLPDQFHIVRTTRNCALPLIMRAYASPAFPSG